MPNCWCPLMTYKDEKLSRANVHMMGKFVVFILISMCILGSCRYWLSNEIYFTPPSLFISLFLNFSLTRRKCSRKSSTCSNWIKSRFDLDAKQWKSQRKNVLIFRVRVGGSTLGFLFFFKFLFPTSIHAEGQNCLLTKPRTLWTFAPVGTWIFLTCDQAIFFFLVGYSFQLLLPL